jgi:outer membrane cobalamin receptor
MNKIFFSICFLIFFGNIFAQNTEPCGTMYLIEKAKKENPKADSIMNVFETGIQDWIKANKPFNNYQRNEYPKIEGFEATGNAEVDKINFGIAKQALYNNNPDKYRAMTRIANTNKNTEQEKRTKK